MTENDNTEDRLSSTPPAVAVVAKVVIGSKIVSAAGAAICVVEYNLSSTAQKALNVGSADKLDLK
jgi:hypothetical protein